MVLIATLLALERLPVAVMIAGKPTRRATFRRVAWVNLHGFDTVFFGFVFAALVEPSECPDVLPRRLRDVLSNWVKSSNTMCEQSFLTLP